VSTVEISAQVAELIGPEQAAHIRAEALGWSIECRDCSRAVDAATQATAVVVLAAPPEIPGALTVIALTHASCSGSEVRVLPVEEAMAYLNPGPDAENGIDAVAAMWGDETRLRAVLLISFQTSVATMQDSGEITDAIGAALLAAGWELATQMDAAPLTQVEDFAAEYAHQPGGTLRLTLLGERIEIGPLSAGPEWLVAATDELSVYVGPFSLHQWDNEVQEYRIEQALTAGHVVGCTTKLGLAAV
jgi:hypothetical protein